MLRYSLTNHELVELSSSSLFLGGGEGRQFEAGGRKATHLSAHYQRTDTPTRRIPGRTAFFSQFAASDVDRARPTCLWVCGRHFRAWPRVSNYPGARAE